MSHQNFCKFWKIFIFAKETTKYTQSLNILIYVYHFGAKFQKQRKYFLYENKTHFCDF